MTTIFAQQPNGTEQKMTRQDNKELIESLTSSKIYQDYERAFSDATGLPVSLRPIDSWQLPNHGKRHENPLCAMLAEKSKSCAACLQIQQQLSESANFEPATVTCQLGLCDTAVPVRLGDQLIGFLQTGQVLRKKVSESQIDRTSKLVAEWGVEVTRKGVENAYLDTKVVSSRQYDAIIKLLSIFGEHISVVTNQILLQKQNKESPTIKRAKEYIQENQSEDLSLGQVAKAVNTSTFHFCKMFKKATGMNFTEYVSRVRVEKARNLLLNPNLRVSEIAYEVGFQSLTHFNRVFKKITGQSPTEYRAQLAAA
ncbi:MAG TPA: helix-turn-helix domain-containing protein [Verrucomicrobiae bacterium]|nr:helix-turn-helix domain-containing protein [Verrucomicrobiae bacterium]